ncbi:hypothetical protein Y032_0141g2242 [Ancylostoma ceylanicum]|uniref:Uncharacterized protein n=1 Tax=Ancylostoma ceylanicum TaxID=53326 RepID=A0A016T302_9BILA|nr:hypothetical protein Y032_0141g2242 [Ancylostoma ceylanicum]
MLTAHRWYLSLPLFIPFTTSGSIFSIVNVRIASRVRSLETIDEVLQWGTTLAFSIMTLLVSIHLLLFLFSHVIAVPGVHIFNQQNNGQVRGWPGFGCMPYCNGNPRGSGGGSRGRESNPDPVASNEPQPSGPRSDDSDESQISIFNQQNNMNCWSGNCGYPSQDGEGGSSGRGSNGGGPSGRGSSVYGPRGRGSSGCGSRGCGSSGDGSYGGRNFEATTPITTSSTRPTPRTTTPEERRGFGVRPCPSQQNPQLFIVCLFGGHNCNRLP